MNSSLLERGSIVVAVFVFGIMAGFFWTYTFNVNRAMLQVDGETYAIVQSLFNRNVRHPMFFVFFFGGGIFSVLALLLNYRHWQQPSFWMLSGAVLVYVLGIIVFTRWVNLPLNYYTESWNPQQLPADWESVRAQWNTANAWRVGTAALAFLLGLLALMVSREK